MGFKPQNVVCALLNFISDQLSCLRIFNMKTLALLGVFAFSFSAFATNGRTTYQAKIIKPDGNPLEDSNVNFRFTVLDTAGSCALYVEDYTAVNMTDTGGLISFALGSGTRSFPSSGTSMTFRNIFENVGPFACRAPNLTVGSYAPSVDDARKIVMQFQDSSGWQTLPAMSINAVPYAMYAHKSNSAINSQQLNGKTDAAFVENSTLAALNCNPATHAITFNGVSFSCIAVGGGGGSGINSVTTSGTVLTTGGTASAPVISITAATMSSDGYLTSLDYAEFKAKLGASQTQIINTLGFAPVSSTAVATQISTVIGGVTSSQVLTSVNDTVAASASNVANAIVKRDSSGNSSFSGISAAAASLNYVDIYKPSTSFNIRLQAPTSLAANYTLMLPTSSGTSGQVLSTDGAGNLSWVNPANGSVTSVSATAPLVSTGGATPTISITQATSSTNGYLSSTDFNAFNNKQAATSAAIIATLGYTPATSATLAASFVQKAGDTMTGILNLPSDGLAVGINQLIVSGSNVGVGVLNPEAALQLKAGTTTYAPLKLTSGTLLSSAQSGTIEYDGSQLYFTDGLSIRRALATNANPGSFDNTSSISNTSGNITLSPNNITGSVIVNSLAASISSGTGALVVNGGVGIAGSINAGGNIISSANIQGANVIGTSSVSAPYIFSGAGTAALPSHTFSTDAATGMWQPTSGALALSSAGSERMRILSNGNVGIGTTSPGANLEVSGTVKITGGAPGAGKVLTSDASGLASWVTLSASQWNTSGTTINYMAGKVGIGDTNPSFKLSLSGTATTADRKIGINGTQVVYLPDQTNFTGSLFIGDGGGLLSHSSGIQGFYNTSVGIGALVSNTTGARNVANGYQALAANTTGGDNVANGYRALAANTTGSGNVANGSFTLSNNTTGNYNVANGQFALSSNTTGIDNVANGHYALYSNTTGSNNTANGANSLNLNTSGTANVANGDHALYYNRARSQSTAIGYNSMYYAHDSSLPGITYNTAIGAYSLYGSTTAGNNWGTQNTALGHSALRNLQSGSGNVGVGYNAGSAITTGSNNVVIGSNTGSSIATSSNNILISDGAGNERMRITSAGAVGIGTTSPGYKLDVSGTINIASGSALAFGGTSVCTAAGCTSSSDERLKENIKPLDFDLNKLLSLNAVEYDWKNKAKYGDKHQIGFIAQKLEQVYPEVVYTDKNTGLKSVTYGHLVAPIVEALKSLYKRIVGVEDGLGEQRRQIASIVESKADKEQTDLALRKLASENQELKEKAKEIDSVKAENAALKAYLCSKDPNASICK